MKLFVVVYIFGLVAGSIGPSPLSMKECEKLIASELASCDDSNAPADAPFRCSDIKLQCEYLAEHPEIQYRLEQSDG